MWYALPLLLQSVTASAAALDEPMIELLDLGEIVGDGKTPVTLHLLVLDEDAQPYQGLEMKFGVDRRVLENLEDMGGGLYRAQWVPPLAGSSRPLKMELRAKTLERERLNRSWSVPMRPPVGHDLSITASPTSLITGDEGVNLSVALSSGSVESRDQGALRLAASVGEPGAISGAGAGTYAARLDVPEATSPRCVQVTAVDARAPEQNYGAMAVPQTVRETVRVTGEADSQLMVRVGDRERGPFPADAYGAAKVELDLPPGTEELVVTSLVDGQRKEATQAVTLAAARRVQLFPLPETIGADPATPYPLRVHVVAPDCRPDAAADLDVQVTAGSVGEPHHEGYGVYVIDYTPPERPGPLTVTASLAGGGWDQASKASTNLGPASTDPVSTLTVTSETQRVQPNGLSAVALTVVARDARGLPVRDLPLSLTVFRGDGSLPATATTDAEGVADVFFTAGRTPGLIGLLVEGGGHTANLDLLQLPPDVAPELILP